MNQVPSRCDPLLDVLMRGSLQPLQVPFFLSTWLMCLRKSSFRQFMTANFRKEKSARTAIKTGGKNGILFDCRPHISP